VPGADDTVYTNRRLRVGDVAAAVLVHQRRHPQPDTVDEPRRASRCTPTGQTITIRLKPDYRWSDGKPITSQDVLFFIDEVKAAVKESGANWGYYQPQVGIPDQVVSASHAERQHGRDQPE